MTDDEIIKIGDICAYFYDNQNKSFSIVEVVEELSDECVVVKFHQVLLDDSSNDFFTYLCDKGKTMNVSKKYLHKINLINCQKAEIERLKQENKEYCEANRIIAYQRNQRDKEIRALHNQLNGLNFMDKQIKSESVKKFAEKLKDSADKTRIKNMETEKVVFYMDEFKLDKLVKEMTEVQEK